MDPSLTVARAMSVNAAEVGAKGVCHAVNSRLEVCDVWLGRKLGEKRRSYSRAGPLEKVSVRCLDGR
jgi:hypothetical protein